MGLNPGPSFPITHALLINDVPVLGKGLGHYTYEFVVIGMPQNRRMATILGPKSPFKPHFKATKG